MDSMLPRLLPPPCSLLFLQEKIRKTNRKAHRHRTLQMQEQKCHQVDPADLNMVAEQWFQVATPQLAQCPTRTSKRN